MVTLGFKCGPLCLQDVDSVVHMFDVLAAHLRDGLLAGEKETGVLCGAAVDERHLAIPRLSDLGRKCKEEDWLSRYCGLKPA
jgi:hypothetical protein